MFLHIFKKSPSKIKASLKTLYLIEKACNFEIMCYTYN